MGFDAEYSYVPSHITTRAAFYEHVLSNLKALLDEGSEQKVNWVMQTPSKQETGLSTVPCFRTTSFKEVTALASVSSVLYNAYADFPQFGQAARVNWAGKIILDRRERALLKSSPVYPRCSGFYVIPALVESGQSGSQEERLLLPTQLLLGPYHGRPGCLRIPLSLKRKGVCANAFLSRKR